MHEYGDDFLRKLSENPHWTLR